MSLSGDEHSEFIGVTCNWDYLRCRSLKSNLISNMFCRIMIVLMSYEIR